MLKIMSVFILCSVFKFLWKSCEKDYPGNIEAEETKEMDFPLNKLETEHY